MKKGYCLLAVICALLLCGVVLLQSVSSVAGSGTLYVDRVNELVSRLDADRTLVRMGANVSPALRGSAYDETQFTELERDVLTTAGQQIKRLNTVKYVLFGVFAVLAVWLIVRNRFRGVRALAVCFLIAGAAVAVTALILIKAHVLGAGADNRLILFFIPRLGEYLASAGKAAQAFDLAFIQRIGWGILRFSGVIAGALALLSLVGVFCRVKQHPTDVSENYMYQ